MTLSVVQNIKPLGSRPTTFLQTQFQVTQAQKENFFISFPCGPEYCSTGVSLESFAAAAQAFQNGNKTELTRLLNIICKGYRRNRQIDPSQDSTVTLFATSNSGQTFATGLTTKCPASGQAPQFVFAPFSHQVIVTRSMIGQPNYIHGLTSLTGYPLTPGS